MRPLPAGKEVARIFLRLGLRARRTRFFFLLVMIPVLLLGILRLAGLIHSSIDGSVAEIYSRILMLFYFQLLIPVLALFYGSGVVNDEVENRTLVYLTTSPLPKPSIFFGKYLAQLLILFLIAVAGFLFSFLISPSTQLTSSASWTDFLIVLGTALLALFAYSGLFSILGSLMRKSIMVGLFFMFGWEGVVQYFPGSTQKFTIIHYIRSLLPFKIQQNEFLVFNLESSSTSESVITLLVIGLAAILIAALIFQKKEYVLSENV